MHSHRGTHGFTLKELAMLFMVLLIALMFASLFIDGGGKSREKGRQRICLSQMHQLTTACLSYSQDHQGRFPGVEWVKELTPHVKKTDIFSCPSDSSMDNNAISYGYNGLMVHPDGSGVLRQDINSPAEVGLLCDAGPTPSYPKGGLVAGDEFETVASGEVVPAPRHSNGTIVGYADGHVMYVPNGYNAHDISNGVTRAFYLASSLGFVNNPAGGICGVGKCNTAADPISIGGEPCTAPILRAAAGVWAQQAHAAVSEAGFSGQDDIKGRTENYLWGTGDGVKPDAHAVAIARDALVLIAAKNAVFPGGWTCGQAHGNYALSKESFQRLFSAGALAGVQAYTYNSDCGTRRFFCARLGQPGKPLPIGDKANVVPDDVTMVNLVAQHPNAIGYCSAAFADLNRVQILGLQGADGKVYYYPQSNPKYRWRIPDNPTWPLMRTLYAQYGGKAWQKNGAGIVNVMLTPGAPGTKALQEGPLFQASYYPVVGSKQ